MRLAIVISAIASLCLNLPACAEDQPTATQSLNATFRSLYKQSREHYKEQATPVILSMGGNLILYRNGTRQAVPVIPPEWQTLKTVDHVPLAIFVVLEDKVGQALAPVTIENLQAVDHGVRAAQAEIAATKFSPTTAARQVKILQGSLDFIAKTLADKQVDRARFDSFISDMGKLSLENAYDAEVLELGIVDDTVHKWKAAMSPEEWKQLHVVVCGGHMPRAQEHSMQYFMSLLNEKEEGKRIVFMENNDDEEKALDLLATHILDARVASGFFHDPWRMHRDLLSDGARRYLQQHHPAE